MILDDKMDPSRQNRCHYIFTTVEISDDFDKFNLTKWFERTFKTIIVNRVVQTTDVQPLAWPMIIKKNKMFVDMDHKQKILYVSKGTKALV